MLVGGCGGDGGGDCRYLNTAGGALSELEIEPRVGGGTAPTLVGLGGGGCGTPSLLVCNKGGGAPGGCPPVVFTSVDVIVGGGIDRAPGGPSANGGRGGDGNHIATGPGGGGGGGCFAGGVGGGNFDFGGRGGGVGGCGGVGGFSGGGGANFLV